MRRKSPFSQSTSYPFLPTATARRSPYIPCSVSVRSRWSPWTRVIGSPFAYLRPPTPECSYSTSRCKRPSALRVVEAAALLIFSRMACMPSQRNRLWYHCSSFSKRSLHAASSAGGGCTLVIGGGGEPCSRYFCSHGLTNSNCARQKEYRLERVQLVSRRLRRGTSSRRTSVGMLGVLSSITNSMYLECPIQHSVSTACGSDSNRSRSCWLNKPAHFSNAARPAVSHGVSFPSHLPPIKFSLS